MSKTKDSSQPHTIIKRNYSGTSKAVDDVFKLDVSSMRKWTSPHLDSNYDTYEQEHCHIFHTYQSGGKANFEPSKDEPNVFIGKCAPIGGHCHEIKFKMSKDEEGVIEILEVSGPLEPRIKTIRGQKQIVFLPIDEELGDTHKHEMSYLKSTDIPKQNNIPAAINMVASEAMKTAPISGIGSGGTR